MASPAGRARSHCERGSQWHLRMAVLAACLGVALLPCGAAAALPRLDFAFMVPAVQNTSEFLSPLGLGYDAKGERLYVADTGHSRIVVYNKSGVMLNSFKHWVKYFDGTRVLGEPWRVLPAGRGAVLVADRLSDRIDVVDLFGATVDSINITEALGLKERAMPGSMGRDAAGNIYLLENTTFQIVVFDKLWRKLRAFGPDYNAEDRVSSSLADLAVAPDGTTYLIDSVIDNTVSVFDPMGKPVRTFGHHGDKKANFHHPIAVDLDSQGRLWIADAFSHDIKVYTPEGEFVTAFGDVGTGRGEFYFPSDVVITGDMLYVVERAGVRLQAFHISGS